jgi:hypothetical protein
MHKSKQCGWIYVKNKENNKKNIIGNDNNKKSVTITTKDPKSSNNNLKNNKKNHKDIDINNDVYKQNVDKDPFRFELCANTYNSINNNSCNKSCNDNKNIETDKSKTNKFNEENNIEYKFENNDNNSNEKNDENNFENTDANNSDSDEKNESIESENNSDKNSFKKILCYNIIYNGSCKYGDKCLYAHSLEDQNINKMRKEVYDILKSESDLSDINLKENYELYKTMLEMTKYCKNCNNNMCKGGYNCKSGVYDKKYCICINDLNYGFCHNYNCNFIHLSKRGLKPYYDKKKNQIITKSPEDKNTLFSNNEDHMNNIISELHKNINSNKFVNNDDFDDDFDDDDVDDNSDNSNIDNTEKIEKNFNINYREYIEIVCNRSIFKKSL